MGRRPFVRERILEAAFDLFARRGYEAVSTREIAAAAKVGHASMYRHFASKEALGREVYARALGPIRAGFAALEARDLPPRRAAAEAVRMLCGWYDERPRALALLVFPPHDFTPAELAEDDPAGPRQALRRALGCDAETLAVVWGAMTGPLQDRYLRRRTGAMTPAADGLARIIQRLVE